MQEEGLQAEGFTPESETSCKLADRKKGCLATTIETDQLLQVSAITIFAVEYFCRLEDAEKVVSQEICSGSRSLQGMPQAVSCLARVLGQIWHCAARALSGY